MRTGHNFEQLTGQIFGRLTVLDDEPDIDENRNHIYLCQCECGEVKYIRKESLKKGTTLSCGCLRKELVGKQGESEGKNRFLDLTNQRFERLLVISVSELDKFGRYTWLCKCDCGNKKIVRSNNLKNGHVKSCGCLNSDLVIQRHKDYRESKGLNPDELMEDSERVKFKESGLIKEILKRDKHTCQCCFNKSGNLEVHHIYHWSTHIELRYEKTNLITLCKKCHRDIIHNGNLWNPADEKTIKFLTSKIKQGIQ